MKSQEYLLGVDVGISVTKAALFDSSGTEIQTVSRKTTLISPQPGWAEVSMTEMWEMTVAAMRELLELTRIKSSQIAGVGVTGNMVGVWLIDAQGRPVRKAILVCDNRTRPLFEQLIRQQSDILHQIYCFSGCVMEFGCTLPLIRWLADHEPDSLRKAHAVFCCKDWLCYQLTSSIHLDYTEASVLPGDNRQRTYSEPLFDLLGISQWRRLLPRVVASEQVVGTVTPHAAVFTGLQAGTPVVAGAGDVPSSTIGAGAVEPGLACTVLGTTCHNSFVIPQPSFEPPDVGLLFALPESSWLRTMVNLTGTPNLDWAIEQFCGLEASHAVSRRELFDSVQRLAQQSPPGANGVIYHPYLNPVGVIAPFVEPTARAQFFGIKNSHKRHDLLRAVYEGVALAIRDCYDAIGMPEEIHLVGGGAQSEFWCQIIADCTGSRIVIPNGSEFGAKGAALLAAVGLHWFDNIAEAARATISIGRTYQPYPDVKAVYDAVYATYCQLRTDLRRSWQLQHAFTAKSDFSP
ncbi:putative erythritol kinase protein [Candidatus Vecturithrix granuli]|uniref:Putative erythritol kinase protein n=1 Tax=Vecturithrix granuli TaxID=1499967 RepID=A0A081C2A3_VECG1|nr:putative erythritol kinase protein [Candidatus Vecturithrix granuli]